MVVLSVDQAAQLYQEIASAAESGWDFSTRWMSHNGHHANTLQSLRTSHVIPVDLNAILCQVEITLSRLSSVVHKEDDADYYSRLAANRAEAIESVLWNETAGIWQDFDAESRQQIEVFYASALVPLSTRCYNQQMTDNVTRIRNVVAAVKVWTSWSLLLHLQNTLPAKNVFFCMDSSHTKYNAYHNVTASCQYSDVVQLSAVGECMTDYQGQREVFECEIF